jgi:competence protein ComEC
MVAFILFISLKASRVPSKAAYLLTASALIFYCLLTGARVPAIRATLMAVIILIGRVMDRRSSIGNNIAIAAILILAFDPRGLFSLSFQFSFISVIAIVSLSPRIYRLFPGRLREGRKSGIPLKLFSASSAAWISLMPLTIYYFRIITPVAIFANMVIVPYLSIVVGSGILAAAAGALIPEAAPALFGACELLIVILTKLISAFSGAPGSHLYL